MFTARENISAKPIARPLRRRPSMTMPGSLFPRSSSIEPDSSPRCLGEEQRRVRFATGITSPLHRDIHQDGGGEKIMAGPSHLPQDSQAKTSREAEEVAKSPLRPRAVPSVKAAVERFHVNRDEVGPSILLPSLNSSPGKGKAKDGARVDGIQKNSRYASDEQPEGHPGVAHLNSVKRKGKQRAYEALPGSKKQDASGDNCVRGKERELVTAREEHDRNEKRWERDPDVEMERVRDKVRIRKLEQEIMMLKNEVCTLHPRKRSPPGLHVICSCQDDLWQIQQRTHLIIHIYLLLPLRHLRHHYLQQT